MFLHDGQVAVNRPLPHLSKLIDGVLYPLWDIGLKVGHSVRSIDDCVKIANADMQSKTSLIESRRIEGDDTLFRKFQKALLARCVDGFEEKYIAQRLEDQSVRRAKFGNSACMQEPNLKNGCGGLRDFQNLLWMAFFKYRTRSLRELRAKGIRRRDRAQATGGRLRLPAPRADRIALSRQPRRWTRWAKICNPPSRSASVTATAPPAGASRNSCAISTRTCGTFSSSRARWNSAWPCCRRRPAGFRCAPGCPNARGRSSRWTDFCFGTAKSAPPPNAFFATGRSA